MVTNISFSQQHRYWDCPKVVLAKARQSYALHNIVQFRLSVEKFLYLHYFSISVLLWQNPPKMEITKIILLCKKQNE
jgi:hypothetical protein